MDLRRGCSLLMTFFLEKVASCDLGRIPGRTSLSGQSDRCTWCRTMSRKGLLWLVPVFVTIHNLEEALFMPAFLQARNSSIPAGLRSLLPPITYQQFLVALIIMTSMPYLIAWLGNLERERSGGAYLLLGLQVVMLYNVLAHIVMAAAMGGYAPGVVTALIINLPFSLYLLPRALRERWAPHRVIVLLFPIGLIVHAVGLPSLIILAGSF